MRTFFSVEAGERFIKVAKGARSASGKEFVAFKAVPCSTHGVATTEKTIIALLHEFNYRRDPVIFSLPRDMATLRYIKVPACDPLEIERLVAFQAPRYIPYPPEELITGYELIRTDSEGFAHVNLIIAHRDTVAVYLKVCQALKLSHPLILLSSLGLCRSFHVLKPDESAPVIVLDVDDDHVEFAVSCQGVLTFSRSLKFDGFEKDWSGRLVDEMTRTLEVYSKEVSRERPGKIFLLGKKDRTQAILKILGTHTTFMVQEIIMNGHIRFASTARSDFERSTSFYSLIGLDLIIPKATLFLLPAHMKETLRRKTVGREYLKISGVYFMAILFLVAAMGLNVHNKSAYLGYLRGELKRMQTEVAPLDEIDRRLALLKNGGERFSVLKHLGGIHQLIPEGILLNAFECDSGSRIVLRGQSPALDGVFGLARNMETDEAFKGYAVEVNHAVKKNMPAGEMVDFEIVANRK